MTNGMTELEARNPVLREIRERNERTDALARRLLYLLLMAGTTVQSVGGPPGWEHAKCNRIDCNLNEDDLGRYDQVIKPILGSLARWLETYKVTPAEVVELVHGFTPGGTYSILVRYG